MAMQLPQEQLGTAIGVLVYSLTCLLASFLMIGLLAAHHEGKSYVAVMSYATALGSGASIAQQVHTIIRWRDIKIDQHQHALSNPGNAELIIAGQSEGLDLVLFYLQFYSYNVTALAVFFWATALAQSIFQTKFIVTLRGKWNMASKAVAVVLPGISISLLRLDVLQHSTLAFLIVADMFLVVAISGSIVTLLVILVKYVNTRRKVMSWHVRYGERSASSTLTDETQSDGKRRRRTIYDNWLVLRFSIAAVTMGVFQLVTVTFQLGSAQMNSQSRLPPQPDLSMERLHGDLLTFLPGVSASLLTFVVFGTTKTFRDYMWVAFVPRWLKGVFVPRGTETLESEPPTPVMPPAGYELGAPPGRIDAAESIRLSEIHVERHGKIEDVDEWPMWKGLSHSKGRAPTTDNRRTFA